MTAAARALMAVVLAGVLAAPAVAAPSDLVGSWKLNHAKSEPPKGPEGDGRRVRPGGGPDGFNGPGGGGARPGGPGGMSAGAGPGERGGGRRGFLGGAEALQLKIEGTEVRLITGEGQVRLLTPDGTAQQRTRGFAEVEETARWDAGRLVVTSVMPSGATMSETLALADDGSGRLVHIVAIERRDRGETKAVWVYDRAGAAR